MRKIIAILAILVFSITACRYEEGPFLTVYTPEQRLIRTWTLQGMEKNGKEVTSSIWTANKIGAYYYFAAYGNLIVTTIVNGELREGYTGSWTFQNNSKELKLDFFLIDVHYTYTARIKKLTTTELIYEYTDVNGDKWRLQMYAQGN